MAGAIVGLVTRSAKRLSIGFVALGILLIGLSWLLAPSLYEVVDKGEHLRPYPTELVYELRFADSITLYVDGEAKHDSDFFVGIGLVVLTTSAGITALLLRAAGGSPRLRRFYTLAALGLGWLTFDELMGVHETAGHNLPFLADLPGVEHPDDLLFALYTIPAIAFVVVFREVIARARRWFAAAIGLLFAAAVSDLAGLRIDDLFEALVLMCMSGGLISLIVTDLREGLGLESLASRRL
jgi:hypothetical protein